MKKLAIITLTYNKFNEATKPYLDSLYKYTNIDDFDLIIVDNASSDETKEYIKEFQKTHFNIKLIENKENLGYSKGNNIGLKEVLNKDYKYIGLLNNDILFTPNWLNDTITMFDEDDSLGMVSPRIQKGKKITKENYLNKYKSFLSKFKDKLKYTIEPLFCCVLIKKEVIEKTGLMDENFSPAFWEDNDYCFRAMYSGYALAISNQSFVFHNHSTTSLSIDKSIRVRNKEYFFKKHPLGKYIWEHKRTNVLKDIKRYIMEGFN